MTVIVIRCDRCGRRCRNPAAFVTDEWNAILRQGVVVGICARTARHRRRTPRLPFTRMSDPIPVRVKYQLAQRNC
jgi:hypothetical protein